MDFFCPDCEFSLVLVVTFSLSKYSRFPVFPQKSQHYFLNSIPIKPGPAWIDESIDSLFWEYTIVHLKFIIVSRQDEQNATLWLAI